MFSKYALELQIWSSLALGAFLVAYLSSGRNLTRFAVVFAASFIVLSLLFFGFVRVLKVWRESGKLHQRVVQQLAAARALSTRDAEQKALMLLFDPKLYLIVENPISDESLGLLGSELQKFFSRFELIREIKGETTLDRSQIGASKLREGFLRIGTDMDFTEIVARPHDDTIYVVDGTEPEAPPREEGYPTIYHYIAAGYPDSSDSDKQANA